jgi:hypothetical protein
MTCINHNGYGIGWMHKNGSHAIALSGKEKR